jgi:hypothetical protein
MHSTEVGGRCPIKTAKPINHKGGVDLEKRKFDNNSSEGFGRGIRKYEYVENSSDSLLHLKTVRLSNLSIDEKSESQNKGERFSLEITSSLHTY